jgi:hypothetical protein
MGHRYSLGELSESLWYSYTIIMDLVHKMMKKRKWVVRADKQRQGDGMGHPEGGKKYSWISNSGRW